MKPYTGDLVIESWFHSETPGMFFNWEDGRGLNNRFKFCLHRPQTTPGISWGVRPPFSFAGRRRARFIQTPNGVRFAFCFCWEFSLNINFQKVAPSLFPIHSEDPRRAEESIRSEPRVNGFLVQSQGKGAKQVATIGPASSSDEKLEEPLGMELSASVQGIRSLRCFFKGHSE